MKKIFCVLVGVVVISSEALAQHYKFSYCVYAEKQVVEGRIIAPEKLYESDTELNFVNSQLDVATFNWQETLYKEAQLTKHTYLCRTKTNADIVLVTFLKIKKPVKQHIVAIFTSNRTYYFLDKIKP